MVVQDHESLVLPRSLGVDDHITTARVVAHIAVCPDWEGDVLDAESSRLRQVIDGRAGAVHGDEERTRGVEAVTVAEADPVV